MTLAATLRRCQGMQAGPAAPTLQRYPSALTKSVELPPSDAGSILTVASFFSREPITAPYVSAYGPMAWAGSGHPFGAPGSGASCFIQPATAPPFSDRGEKCRLGLQCSPHRAGRPPAVPVDQERPYPGPLTE